MLWGWHEGARGGLLVPWCGASGVGRSPLPDRPTFGRAAGARYPLAVGGGGAWAWGPVTYPTARALAGWLCALLGRQEGAQGGASCLGMGRPGLGTLPRPTDRPWGVRLGPATHWLWVRGLWVRGPVINPTARALATWLCVLWERQEGARGQRLLPWCEASGVGRSPTQTARLWGVRPGPATHWLWVRSVWAWGPATYPTARAPASWLCVLWGRHEGALGGDLLAWVWGFRAGALSAAQPPVLGACGRGPLPTGSGCGGVGVGTRHTRFCELALRAVGGCILPGCGASGVGRSPLPDRPSLGRAAGARYPPDVGAGGVGVGTRDQPHSARSCELALRAVGAARGRPGGAPVAWVWGVQGWALYPARPLIVGA